MAQAIFCCWFFWFYTFEVNFTFSCKPTYRTICFTCVNSCKFWQILFIYISNFVKSLPQFSCISSNFCFKVTSSQCIFISCSTNLPKALRTSCVASNGTNPMQLDKATRVKPTTKRYQYAFIYPSSLKKPFNRLSHNFKQLT